MNKKISMLIGISMLIIAGCFIIYAMNHPESSFPWSNKVTYIFYGIYIWLLYKFLLEIPLLKTLRKVPSNGSLIRAALFFFLAIIFLIMEISWDTVGLYTIARGVVIMGGIDRGIENLSLVIKQNNKK